VWRRLPEVAGNLARDPPAILANRALPTAIKELARRSTVPVQLDVAVTQRLPEPIETATYYLAKHAHASTVHVQVDADDTAAADGALRVWVRDDGCGGADPAGGSGLVALKDRVDALGGHLWLYSPPGAGTTLQAELPLSQAPPPRWWFGCTCDSSASSMLAD
jgi:signal transduction histidine kinase